MPAGVGGDIAQGLIYGRDGAVLLMAQLHPSNISTDGFITKSLLKSGEAKLSSAARYESPARNIAELSKSGAGVRGSNDPKGVRSSETEARDAEFCRSKFESGVID